MNEKSNRYTLAALKDRRATIAAELVRLDWQLRHRREQLAHVDATLRILDSSVDTDAIPNKRLSRRVKLFGQGELGRLILDALRQAGGEALSTAEIVTAVLDAGGHGESARSALAGRVRGNLAYLERRGRVGKVGNGKGARWALVTD